MSNNQLLDFHKEIYFFEIQRSEIFDNRLQVPIAAEVLLIGFQAFMIKGINFANSPQGVATFCVFFIFSLLCTIISLYFLKQAWGGSKYQFIPLASTLDNYRTELMEHYEETDFHEGTEAGKTYQKTLINYFITCSSFNSEINEHRARNLYLGVGFLGGATLFSIVSFIPYFGYDLEFKEKTDKVEIVSPVKVIQ
jgi:hypothetical protein